MCREGPNVLLICPSHVLADDGMPRATLIHVQFGFLKKAVLPRESNWLLLI